MATSIELRLKRDALADWLSEQGFPISKATLAKMASVGGGPPFYKFGKHTIYVAHEALEWAKDRTRKGGG